MNIDMKDFLLKEMDDVEIIDIRDPRKYALGHIPRAKNIPSYLLQINPDNYLNKDKEYYLYCQSGNTSQALSNRLNSMGFHVINIYGGYLKYNSMKRM